MKTQFYKRLSSVLFTACVLVIGLSSVAAQNETSPIINGETGESLDSYLQALEPFGFSGTALIASGDEVLLENGYGFANIEDETPMPPDAIFGIASVSKDFTAAAMLMLVAGGQATLEDTLAQYLEDVPADKADITIQQVLEMTAGFQAYHDTEGDYQIMSEEEALRLILAQELVSIPGTEYHYSNSGYTLLAILVQQISGQSYEDYLRDHIFKPLGMTHTGFSGESFDDAMFASTNNPFNGYGSPEDWPSTWATKGAGGIASSVGDLYRFYRAILTGELLPTEISQVWFDFSDGRFIAGGGSSDFSSTARYLAPEDAFLILLSNGALIRAEQLNPPAFLEETFHTQLARIVRGETFTLPPQVTTLGKDILDAYNGAYRLDSGGTLSISTVNGKLGVEATGTDAVNAILGDDAELNEQIATFSERSLAAIEAASQGDFQLQFEALGGQATLVQVEQNNGGLWERWRADNGEFQSAELLWGAPNLSGIILITMKLNFENGEVYVQYGWQHGNLDIIQLFDSEPSLQTIFWPQTEADFTTFSITRASYSQLHFTTDEDGVISGLVLNEEFAATRF